MKAKTKILQEYVGKNKAERTIGGVQRKIKNKRERTRTSENLREQTRTRIIR